MIRTGCGLQIGTKAGSRWVGATTLDVRCWMFDVGRFQSEGQKKTRRFTGESCEKLFLRYVSCRPVR